MALHILCMQVFYFYLNIALYLNIGVLGATECNG